MWRSALHRHHRRARKCLKSRKLDLVQPGKLFQSSGDGGALSPVRPEPTSAPLRASFACLFLRELRDSMCGPSGSHSRLQFLACRCGGLPSGGSSRGHFNRHRKNASATSRCKIRTGPFWWVKPATCTLREPRRSVTGRERFFNRPLRSRVAAAFKRPSHGLCWLSR